MDKMVETIVYVLIELIRTVLPVSIVPIILYYYFTSTFDFWSRRGVPFRKPTVLLGNFGDLLLFRKSQPEGIKSMYNWFANARFIGVYRVRSPILILRDPELVKQICVKDFACFTNRAIPVNSTDPLSGHLFNLEGKAWKRLRSKLTPAFSSAKIKLMFYLLVECHETLRKLIAETSSMLEKDEGGFEVRELATKFTIDVIGSCAFGININALRDDDSAFKRMASRLSKPSYKATLWRMLRTAIPTLYRILGVQVIDPEVTSFFKSVVSQMIAQRENESGTKRHDFMDLLIELKHKGSLDNDNKGSSASFNEGEPEDKKIELDDNAIAAQAFVFFVAGNETSSNTIAFCLYELALNEEIQEKARREILDSIDKRDGKLIYEAVQEMKYLDTIVMETLRKYPPAPLVSRKCEYSYKIPGTEIELPAGMRVVIPIYGLHHDPDYYPQPDKFDPDRFTNENKGARHPYTYLPFGEGPRNCIGMRFAMLQTKIGIISFIRDHRVEVCEKTVIPIKFSKRSLVTTSEGGFWLKIKKIT